MTLQAALESFCRMLPEPSFLVWGSGQIQFANDAAARLTRMPPVSLVGGDLASLVADDPAKVRGFLGRCARSRQLLPGGLAWRTPGSEPLDLRCDGAVLQPADAVRPPLIFLRCRPRTDAADRFVILNQKIDALSKEVIERRKAEQQRDELLRKEREAREQAERAGVMKDEFLATLSHELRTPLNAILGWSQVIAQDTAGLGAATRDGVTAIHRNARMQARLIEDLLDMSRIVSGKLRLDVQSVDLVLVIEAAINALQPAADAKGIRIQQTLDSTVPMVKGDPARLQQVLWNLLSNAIKFTPKHGRVQVVLQRVNSHLEILVSDTGEGIAPAFLPHVFDRFRQADSSITKRHAGLGLGLAIVKQLVELHGGHVTASSPGEGLGAAFLVVLPVSVLGDTASDDLASVAPPPETSAPRIASAPSLAGLTILVVDDEPDARELLQLLLGRAGAAVVAASGVDDALRLARETAFDVLLTDLGMPERDGYDLLREFRRLPRTRPAPAIALTAFVRHEDRTTAMLAGFQVHLCKPVEPMEVIAAVAMVTGRT